jgi:hypothetical protein
MQGSGGPPAAAVLRFVDCPTPMRPAPPSAGCGCIAAAIEAIQAFE